jgi:uncharacterized membrane protein
MKCGKYSLAMLGIILISFAIGAYLYPQMPELMPSHWNGRGDVDGYMPKFWGLFLMPFPPHTQDRPPQGEHTEVQGLL